MDEMRGRKMWVRVWKKTIGVDLGFPIPFGRWWLAGAATLVALAVRVWRGWSGLAPVISSVTAIPARWWW